MSKKISLGLVVVLLISIASIILSITALNRGNGLPRGVSVPLVLHPPKNPIAEYSNLPHGIFVDGKPDTPHYYVTVVPTGPDSIKGGVGYLYQDGQSDVTLTFSGIETQGVAILRVHLAGTSSAVKSGPSAIVMLFTGSKMELGECTSFMKFATSLQSCNFKQGSSPNQ